MKECVVISVNCFKNKSLEIDCEYVGFTFCVEKDQLQETVEFIKKKISFMNMPFEHITLNETKKMNNNILWSK